MIKFDEKPFIEAAEILVAADETERAISLLENLPAFYRDNVPSEIKQLKERILQKITLPYDLLKDDRELPKPDDWSIHYLNSTMRGVQLRHLVKMYNDGNLEPHIVDMGPGDFTFAIGLNREGFKFTYDCYTLNSQAKLKIAERLGSKFTMIRKSSAPVIFLAFEIIEHLHNPHEIRQVYQRIARYHTPEHVMLSTPKYTYSKGTPDWKVEGIHHLRAYTPNEFTGICINMFPDYNFQYADSDVMTIIGSLKK